MRGRNHGDGRSDSPDQDSELVNTPFTGLFVRLFERLVELSARAANAREDDSAWIPHPLSRCKVPTYDDSVYSDCMAI